MPHFPDGFTEHPLTISPFDVSISQEQPFQALQYKGFDVVAGITPADVPAITAIAGQPGVREFCPKDIEERWGNQAMVTKQLAKDGGRGVFRLVDRDNNNTAGFGWTGKAGSDEIAQTGADTTFAIRMNKAYAGQGLATPFTQAITFATMHLYDVPRVGWETWASNVSANRAYLRAGARVTGIALGSRPTLDTSYPLATEGKYAGRPEREDTRLYYLGPTRTEAY